MPKKLKLKSNKKRAKLRQPRKLTHDESIILIDVTDAQAQASGHSLAQSSPAASLNATASYHHHSSSDSESDHLKDRQPRSRMKHSEIFKQPQALALAQSSTATASYLYHHSSESESDHHCDKQPREKMSKRKRLHRQAKLVQHCDSYDSDASLPALQTDSSDSEKSDKDLNDSDYHDDEYSDNQSNDSYGDDEGGSGDGDIDKETSHICRDQLIEHGLEEHLKSPVCAKSIAMTQTMLMRYTRFLVWLWTTIGAAATIQGGFDVCYIISAFIVSFSQLLPKYYMHLKEAFLFKASTIIDHNENFQVLVHWYAVYRVQKDLYFVDPSQLYTVNLIIKSMRKMFARERKIQEATSKDNTIEGLVNSRKWPVGGLQELNDAVVGQMEWAKRLCVKGSIITLSVFNLFMQLFMSSLFTSKY